MLQYLLRDLKSPDSSAVLQAAMSACILGNGQPDAIAAPFLAEGWTREDDSDAGTVMLVPPTDDEEVLVTLYDGGLICDITSEVWGTDVALAAIQIGAGIAGLRLDSIDSADGCINVRLTDTVTAGITSSGQDPVCISEETSSIRLTYAGAN